MGMKRLELNVISAEGLKKESMFGKMSVYVVVSNSGDPDAKHKTPARHDGGGSNPCWNHELSLNLDEEIAAACKRDLVLLLRREVIGIPDKDIGVVRLPLTGLISDYRPVKAGDARFVTEPVRSKSSGEPKGGFLTISYRIKDAAVPQHNRMDRWSTKAATNVYRPPNNPIEQQMEVKKPRYVQQQVAGAQFGQQAAGAQFGAGPFGQQVAGAQFGAGAFGQQVAGAKFGAGAFGPQVAGAQFGAGAFGPQVAGAQFVAGALIGRRVPLPKGKEVKQPNLPLEVRGGNPGDVQIRWNNKLYDLTSVKQATSKSGESIYSSLKSGESGPGDSIYSSLKSGASRPGESTYSSMRSGASKPIESTSSSLKPSPSTSGGTHPKNRSDKMK